MNRNLHFFKTIRCSKLEEFDEALAVAAIAGWEKSEPTFVIGDSLATTLSIEVDHALLEVPYYCQDDVLNKAIARFEDKKDELSQALNVPRNSTIEYLASGEAYRVFTVGNSNSKFRHKDQDFDMHLELASTHENGKTRLVVIRRLGELEPGIGPTDTVFQTKLVRAKQM